MSDNWERYDRQLDRLFAEYRDSSPDLAGSPEFLPRLWERIDQRNTSLLAWRRWTTALAGVAAVFSLVIVLLEMRPGSSPYYQGTYVEALAEEQSPDRLILQDVAMLDTQPELPRQQEPPLP
jgi:hypothetical protein